MAEKQTRKKRKDAFHVLKIVIVALVGVLVVVMTVLAFRAGTLVFTNDGLTAENEPERTYTITIRQGTSTLRIGSELRRAGIIRSSVVFLIQSKLYRCKIAPGTYTLSSRDSSKAILKYLHSEYEKRVVNGS